MIYLFFEKPFMTKQKEKEIAAQDKLPTLDGSLESSIRRLNKVLLTKQANTTSIEKKRPVQKRGQGGKIIQLPLWSDSRRGIPNDLVRGALFTVGNCRTERAFRKSMSIATLGGIDVTYTGEVLRQDDEDVFLQLVHLARLIPLGSCIEFTAHSLLKSLSWATNKPSYDRLKRTIQRLTATGLEISTKTGGYSGSLIRDFEWREEDGTSSRTWKVRLEPRIISLFGHVKYSQIVWEKRLQLGNLAKWLHSFYYSHAQPFPMKVETLRQLCGSTTKSKAKFRQLLKSALNELISLEFLSSAKVNSEDDKVYVTRT
ncbi:MAG: hypothetical protein DRQ56_00455 [Gammaproteobacteria bacterium]|nr:MAG: hypothetical protein DRQ56_00455 [Gammaproteobacteria bacterium]